MWNNASVKICTSVLDSPALWQKLKGYETMNSARTSLCPINIWTIRAEQRACDASVVWFWSANIQKQPWRATWAIISPTLMNWCYFIDPLYGPLVQYWYCSLSSNTQGTILVIFFPASLCYYLWATCHLFISVLVLCSHLNNCAKRLGSFCTACMQVYANQKGDLQLALQWWRCVCDLCLEVKHQCDSAMATAVKHSPILMHFSRSWITTVHTSGEPSDPLHYLRDADTHREPLKPCQDCACLRTLWALTTQPCRLKPLSSGLFMSADMWTHEAGLELKTLRTHYRSRKSPCYALSNLFPFHLS